MKRITHPAPSGIAAADFLSDLSRASLPARAKPYWLLVAPGQHLGLYKGRRTSTWIGRWYVGQGQYRERSLGRADDCHGIDFDGALRMVGEGAANPEAPSLPRPAVRGLGGARPTEPPDLAAQWRRSRPDLDLDLGLVQLFVRVERLQGYRRRWLEALAASEGVGVSDLYVLGALRRAGPPHALRPTDLFRALVVTSGAISKRVDKLVVRGLVTRVADSDDKRSWSISLTKRGVAAADRSMTRIAAMWSDLAKSAALTPHDVQLMEGPLRQLLDRMPGVTQTHIEALQAGRGS